MSEETITTLYYQNPKLCRCLRTYITKPSSEQLKTIYDQYNHFDLQTLPNFLKALGIDDMADLRALWVMWKLGYSKNGKIDYEQFTHGMNLLECKSLNDLKQRIPTENSLINNNEQLKSFFIASFNLNCNGKIIEFDDAELLLHSFYGYQHKIELLLKYMEIEKHQLTKDEWLNIYEFMFNIRDDFLNYDPTDSWPLFFDSFVDWVNTSSNNTNKTSF
ncbi:Defective in cullin neddylation protein [Entamoeba marina]